MKKGTANKKKKVNVCVLDFETGGLNPKIHQVTQMCLKHIDMDTFEVLRTYNVYVKNYNNPLPSSKLVRKSQSTPMVCDFESTQNITGITEDKLNKLGLPFDEAMYGLLNFLNEVTCGSTSASEKIILCGQNLPFDIGFLNQIFLFINKIDPKSRKIHQIFNGQYSFSGDFIPLTLDTLSLGVCATANDNSIQSNKLSDQCRRNGIELFEAHDAEADVQATADLAGVFLSKIRGGGEVKIKNKSNNYHFKV